MPACVLMGRQEGRWRLGKAERRCAQADRSASGGARRTPSPGCSVDGHNLLDKLYSGQNFVLFPYQ